MHYVEIIGKNYKKNMVKRNIAITLDKAIELFNSNDESLKEIVLQAFSKEELMHDFRKITTFKKACEALNLNFDDISVIAKDIAKYSKASAAMFKLNIIRKALNLGQNLHLTKIQKGLLFVFLIIQLQLRVLHFYR